MGMFLRLGNTGSYCVRKGSILLLAFLFRCSSTFILSEKLTYEKCFSTVVAGSSLFLGRAEKFLMFSSKVISEKFVLRSLNASPLIKPFVTPGGWHKYKICVLEGLCRLEMCSHFKDRILVESLYTCVPKNAASVSEIPAVNLSVGWKLFAFRRNSPLPFLLVSHTDVMPSINVFEKIGLMLLCLSNFFVFWP